MLIFVSIPSSSGLTFQLGFGNRNDHALCLVSIPSSSGLTFQPVEKQKGESTRKLFQSLLRQGSLSNIGNRCVLVPCKIWFQSLLRQGSLSNSLRFSARYQQTQSFNPFFVRAHFPTIFRFYRYPGILKFQSLLSATADVPRQGSLSNQWVTATTLPDDMLVSIPSSSGLTFQRDDAGNPTHTVSLVSIPSSSGLTFQLYGICGRFNIWVVVVSIPSSSGLTFQQTDVGKDEFHV